MRFLIIADAASMHTYNYIRHVLSDTDIEVYLFSISYNAIPSEYLKLYKNYNVSIVGINNLNENILKSKNPILRIIKFIYKANQLRLLGCFDIAQLQFINASGCLLLLMNYKKYSKIILTYWGSDILQLKPSLKWIQKLVLRKADVITLCTEKMFRKFKEEFGVIYSSKLHKVNIIVGGLEKIKDIYYKEGIVESKHRFNLPMDKLCIMCGYNGNVAQQQDSILNTVSKYDKDIKDKIHIIMPFMYGCHDIKYILDVKQLLQASGISYTIIEDFLSYDDMARLSLSTDVYLHLRFTDALSATMQEQLYAGSVLIRGSWLEYDEYENTDLPIYKINDINQLSDMLIYVIENFQSIKKCILSEYIWDMSSGLESRKQSHLLFLGEKNEY